MHYKVNQFHFDPKSKVYSQEISTLQSDKVYGRLPSGAAGIMMDELGKFCAAEFSFINADYDTRGEDIAGWNFKPTMAAVQQYPFLSGTRVLIIND